MCCIYCDFLFPFPSFFLLHKLFLTTLGWHRIYRLQNGCGYGCGENTTLLLFSGDNPECQYNLHISIGRAPPVQFCNTSTWLCGSNPTTQLDLGFGSSWSDWHTASTYLVPAIQLSPKVFPVIFLETLFCYIVTMP